MWLGVCSGGVRSSIYIFYSRCMCNRYGALCSVYIMFSIYIIYSICSYDNMGIECRAMYSCVVIWELGGGYHVGWRVVRLCPGGRFRKIGDMRHRSS